LPNDAAPSAGAVVADVDADDVIVVYILQTIQF
jgi:hypothetical protein